MSFRMLRLKNLLSRALVVVAASFSALAADDPNARVLEPASLFTDNAVLQRAMELPVWGWAAPGSDVTVEFAGQKQQAAAGKDGRWMVELAPLGASAQGRTMTFSSSDGQQVAITNVLVGEVWVCCGQSNMQYGWGKESHPMFNWGGDADLAKLAEEGRKRPIRHYHVPVNVSFTPNDKCGGSWSTDIPGSAVAFGFSYYLQEALDIPVATIVTCWGSSSIEGWMPLDMTNELPHFKSVMAKFHSSEAARKRVQGAMDMGIRHGMVFVRKQPNLLYNAMLHPMIPYACRGMVWYQGEANAGKPEEYSQSFPAWLKRLRKGWGRDDFRLLAVMLPGFGQDDGRPDTKSWAQFREAQVGILKLVNTGVANTIDLGDAKNIHPPDKKPVCERLALLARRDIYAQKVTARGPVYKGFSVKGRQMVVEYTEAEGLKTTDGKAPTGFWLSDGEGEWHPATATIQGAAVVLAAEGVDAPVACRYAFCGKPTVNLVNGADLPAYPFRTDEWAK